MSGLSSNSAMEKPYSYASPSTCDDSITDELENVSIGSVECDARSRREFMEEPAPSEKAEIVMLSFLAFVLAFICLRYGLFSRQSFTFSNRAVSMLHAFTVLFLSSLGIQWSSPYERIGCNQNSPAESLVLSVSLGYFMYDTICSPLDGFELTTFLHHLATMAGLGVGAFSNQGGSELVQCLFFMEVSTPFLHMRILLKELGLGSTKLAKGNEAIFALSFLICRIFLSAPVMYYTMISPTQHWQHLVLKTGAVGVWLVSALWSAKIVKIITRTMSSKDSKKCE